MPRVLRISAARIRRLLDRRGRGTDEADAGSERAEPIVSVVIIVA